MARLHFTVWPKRGHSIYLVSVKAERNRVCTVESQSGSWRSSGTRARLPTAYGSMLAANGMRNRGVAICEREESGALLFLASIDEGGDPGSILTFSLGRFRPLSNTLWRVSA